MIPHFVLDLQRYDPEEFEKLRSFLKKILDSEGIEIEKIISPEIKQAEQKVKEEEKFVSRKQEQLKSMASADKKNKNLLLQA